MKTRILTKGAILSALTFIATFSIPIPISFTNGYVHPGDSIVFLTGILLNPPVAFVSAGLGSALSDIALGYVPYAIPTFIIKGLMAFVISYFYHQQTPSTFKLLATNSIIWVCFISAILLLLKNTTSYPASFSGDPNLARLQLLGFTFIIPALFYLSFKLFEKRHKKVLTSSLALSLFLSGLIMIIGYYFVSSIMLGTFVTPIFSIPSNILQFIFGYALFQLIYINLKKHANNLFI